MVPKPPGRRAGDGRSSRPARIQTLGTGPTRPLGARGTRSSSPQKRAEQDVQFSGQNGKSLAGTLLQVCSHELSQEWHYVTATCTQCRRENSYISEVSEYGVKRTLDDG